MTRIWMLIILTVYACNISPPGTVEMKKQPGRYFDRNAIRHIDWMEYMHYLSWKHGKDSEMYLEARPDTTILKDALKGFAFNSNAFHYYPITGITYDQAVDFCRWRSEAVSEKRDDSIFYQLPSKEDYADALIQASAPSDKRGLYAIKRNWLDRHLRRGYEGLTDNAAEMTVEEGIAVHGTARKDTLMTSEYDKPSKSLGFRCVAEIK